jgi:hypothetical protein
VPKDVEVGLKHVLQPIEIESAERVEAADETQQKHLPERRRGFERRQEVDTCSVSPPNNKIENSASTALRQTI